MSDKESGIARARAGENNNQNAKGRRSGPALARLKGGSNPPGKNPTKGGKGINRPVTG